MSSLPMVVSAKPSQRYNRITSAIEENMNHHEIRFKTNVLRKYNNKTLGNKSDGDWYCVYESDAMFQGGCSVEYVKHDDFRQIDRDEVGNYSKCKNFSHAKDEVIKAMMSCIKGLQDYVKSTKNKKKAEYLNYTELTIPRNCNEASNANSNWQRGRRTANGNVYACLHRLVTRS